ncbi:MAG TPA: DinB family protein [Candidatus Acidoferrum sp.]|nr:DinB family protein [Candidatus Acidoferrum sp.]
MNAKAAPQSLPGIAVLEQTPIILEKILLSAGEEESLWKPAADRWSICEVLAHLADTEQHVFRGRVEKMVKEKNPPLASHDQNEAYARGEYSKGSGRENLKVFCHERDRSLSMLRYLSPEALARTGQHEKLGTITVGHLMNEWAFHDLGHIRQIAELFRAKVFYPNAGPFQQFYTVKP